MVFQESSGQRRGDIVIHVSKAQILFTQKVIPSFVLCLSVVNCHPLLSCP